MKKSSERKPGKYDILVAAKELAGYTIKITSAENNFPKRYRLSVVNKIQTMAVDIADWLMMANEIYPETRRELEARILYMKQARAACRSMMMLMEIAANTFNIKMSTFEEWTKQATDVRNHTTAWIMSDKNRFKNL
jgi:hypothetical protein